MNCVFCLLSTRPHKNDLCLNVCVASSLDICERDPVQLQHVNAPEPQRKLAGESRLFSCNVQRFLLFILLLIALGFAASVLWKNYCAPLKIFALSSCGYVLKLSQSLVDANSPFFNATSHFVMEDAASCERAGIDCVSCHCIFFSSFCIGLHVSVLPLPYFLKQKNKNKWKKNKNVSVLSLTFPSQIFRASFVRCYVVLGSVPLCCSVCTITFHLHLSAVILGFFRRVVPLCCHPQSEKPQCKGSFCCCVNWQQQQRKTATCVPLGLKQMTGR